MHVSRLKDGKFKVTIEGPKDPVTGKRKQITRRHEKRRVAIKRANEEYQKRLQSMGMYGTDHTHSPTFREIAEEWYEYYKARNKITTALSRFYALKVIYNYFDNIEVKKIRHKMVQNMLDDMAIKQNYSLSHSHSVKGTLNMILKYAINNGIIIHNPALNTSYPKPKVTVDVLERSESYEKVVSQEILKCIFKITNENRKFYKNLHEYFKLMYYTGCRTGEIAALKNTDVNYSQKTISITKTLFNQNDKIDDYVLLPPKDNEKRVISINDTVIEMLRKLVNENEDKAEVYEGIYRNEGFLFSDSKGHPYFISHVAKKFKRAIRDSGFETNGLTPHSLRHTHTTQLIEAGIPVKVIQERLGHASINTTLGIYAHVTEQIEQLTPQQLDDHLNIIDELDSKE